jgi:hypothetical protein
MLFKEDILFNSMPALEEVEKCYLPNPEKRWVLKDSRLFIISNPYTVSFITLSPRKKLNKSWGLVGRLRCNMRGFGPDAWFPFITLSFCRRFSKYLPYAAFRSLNNQVYEWYLNRTDFDLSTIKSVNFSSEEVWRSLAGREETPEWLIAVEKLRPFNDCVVRSEVIDAYDHQLIERFHDLQIQFPCANMKILNDMLDKKCGKKLFTPFEIDHLEVIPVLPQVKPQMQLRSTTMVDWDAIDWADFYRMMNIRFYDEEISVEKENRKKKAYGFPMIWTPQELIEYCRKYKLNPMNYPMVEEISAPTPWSFPLRYVDANGKIDYVLPNEMIVVRNEEGLSDSSSDSSSRDGEAQPINEHS